MEEEEERGGNQQRCDALYHQLGLERKRKTKKHWQQQQDEGLTQRTSRRRSHQEMQEEEGLPSKDKGELSDDDDDDDDDNLGVLPKWWCALDGFDWSNLKRFKFLEELNQCECDEQFTYGIPDGTVWFFKMDLKMTTEGIKDMYDTLRRAEEYCIDPHDCDCTWNDERDFYLLQQLLQSDDDFQECYDDNDSYMDSSDAAAAAYCQATYEIDDDGAFGSLSKQMGRITRGFDECLKKLGKGGCFPDAYTVALPASLMHTFVRHAMFLFQCLLKTVVARYLKAQVELVEPGISGVGVPRGIIFMLLCLNDQLLHMLSASHLFGGSSSRTARQPSGVYAAVSRAAGLFVAEFRKGTCLSFLGMEPFPTHFAGANGGAYPARLMIWSGLPYVPYAMYHKQDDIVHEQLPDYLDDFQAGRAALQVYGSQKSRQKLIQRSRNLADAYLVYTVERGARERLVFAPETSFGYSPPWRSAGPDMRSVFPNGMRPRTADEQNEAVLRWVNEQQRTSAAEQLQKERARINRRWEEKRARADENENDRVSYLKEEFELIMELLVLVGESLRRKIELGSKFPLQVDGDNAAHGTWWNACFHDYWNKQLDDGLLEIVSEKMIRVLCHGNIYQTAEGGERFEVPVELDARIKKFWLATAVFDVYFWEEIVCSKSKPLSELSEIDKTMRGYFSLGKKKKMTGKSSKLNQGASALKELLEYPEWLSQQRFQSWYRARESCFRVERMRLVLREWFGKNGFCLPVLTLDGNHIFRDLSKFWKYESEEI